MNHIIIWARIDQHLPILQQKVSFNNMHIWDTFSAPQEKSCWDIKNQICKGSKTFLILKTKTTQRPSNYITVKTFTLKQMKLPPQISNSNQFSS